MKNNYTFTLFPTSNPGVKTIYEMITCGNKVILRKSTRIRIQEKNWDKSKKRVKLKEPNSIKINQILDDKEEEFRNENPLAINLSSEQICSLLYMEEQLQRGLKDGTKKVSTYNKYVTILNSLKKSVNNRLGTKHLPFKKLKELDTIREITLGLHTGYRKTGKPKNANVIFNYLSVFKSFVDHWNKYSGTQYPVNTANFFNFIKKQQQKKLAPTITYDQIIKLENYVPTKRRKKSYESQILAKNIFLFQYYSAGIRLIDAITLTNKMIGDDKLVIPVRKTSDFISVPFYFPMILCLKSYFQDEFNTVMLETKLEDVKLDSTSIVQIYRLEGVDLKNMTLEDLNTIILKFTKDKLEPELINHLKEIRIQWENKIARSFFQLIQALPERFLFPQLNIEDFIGTLEKQANFNIEQDYLIHRARTRHNSALKRVGENLKIEGLSGHVPRHTLANHMAFSGRSEEDIRQVLAHSTVRTTKVYLRERHGFSGGFEIMKKFHEGMKKGS